MSESSFEAAVAKIRTDALALKPAAVETLNHILRMSNLDQQALERLRLVIQNNASVAVHFHPDRPIENGVVADGLLRDGVYRNQFETKISNGLVAPVKGSYRDQWEQKLFGDAYCNATLSDRPKYGALDLALASDGPAPRFGSCYLVLKPEVSRRCTFTFGGSQDEPKARGTLDELDAILCAILEQAFTDEIALGMRDVRPAQVLEKLGLVGDGYRMDDDKSHNLDHMIEAQIHGPIRLDQDIVMLVADGSFRECPIGDTLRQMGAKYGFEVRFNSGYSVALDAVPLDFRGARMIHVARAVGNAVTARGIGEVAQNLPEDISVQELKLLWHILVRYGQRRVER